MYRLETPHAGVAAWGVIGVMDAGLIPAIQFRQNGPRINPGKRCCWNELRPQETCRWLNARHFFRSQQFSPKLDRQGEFVASDHRYSTGLGVRCFWAFA
jgi:hypothetical protein